MKNQLVVKCGACRMLEWPCRQIPVEWDLDLDLNLELTPTVVQHPRTKLQRYLSEGHHHHHHDMVQKSSAAVPKRSATMTFHRSVSHPNQPHQGHRNRLVVESSAKLPQESASMTIDRSLSNQPAVKLRRFLSEGHQNKQESSPSASRQRSATVTFNRSVRTAVVAFLCRVVYRLVVTMTSPSKQSEMFTSVTNWTTWQWL
jgi:hypothetical protein